MNNEHRKIFKELITAFEEDTLEEKLKELFKREDVDKNKLSFIISSLSGLDTTYNDDYIKNILEGIRNYTPSKYVVSKFSECGSCCHQDSGRSICEESCPLNAITRNPKDNKIYINRELCMDCGICVDNCEHGGILDKVEFLPLLNLLKSKSILIAAVAPAIMGQFGETANIYKLRTAFKKLGFTDMVEVAFFADMLTLKEAVEYDHFVKTEKDFMITSCCCPMWVGMLKRVYNDLVKNVSPSVSPMIAAGRVMKKINPNCKVVFIGPCLAKKAEAKEKDLVGDIDFVLTFAELKDIFDTYGINVEELEEDLSHEYASRGGRLYARTAGVSTAVGDAIERLFPEKHKYLKTAQAHGVRECKEILSRLQNGEIHANFIEGMGCVGGCVGGPKVLIPKEVGRDFVNDFAENSDIKVAVDSSCMIDVLKNLDITSTEDFKSKEKIFIFEREF